MEPETASATGVKWVRRSLWFWPLFWVAATYGAPQAEKFWDAHQVERDAELLAPADLRRRFEARILRADPPGLRRDWRFDERGTPSRCGRYSQSLSWSLCWKPDGGFDFGAALGWGKLRAEDVVRSVVWVFTPSATAAERARLSAIAKGGVTARATVGGMIYDFDFRTLSANHQAFAIYVAPAR